MKIRFKKLVPHAYTPTKAHTSDAAFDLVAVDQMYDQEKNFYEYGTGLAVEIPEGFVGLLFQRSSVSKMPLSLANAVGVIDPGYRGEVIFRFRPTREHDDSEIYQFSDRIGQLMIIKTEDVEFDEVEDLDNTDRGTGGFGSSGN